MSPGTLKVVTPFYNSAEYLRECIESVLAQTHGDFTYLLVNNMSTDDSGRIAESYAARDTRIQLLSPDTFLNQIQNYSFAIGRAADGSRYCKMVQADDWIFPRCLEELVACAEAYPSAAAVGSYRAVERSIDCVGLEPKRQVISGRAACRLHLFGQAFLFGSPTTLLYRSDVVRAHQPFYTDGRYHDDTEAMFEVMGDHDFGFVPQVLSFSRRQADSITGGSRQFIPHDLDHYMIVKSYGPRYLTSAEYEEQSRSASNRYYYGLARQLLAELFSERETAFWEYQTRGLATIGERIDRALLLRHALSLAAQRSLNLAEVARAAAKATRELLRSRDSSGPSAPL
jgi:glycosyltransferase involved in cell wall biosynthesis